MSRNHISMRKMREILRLRFLSGCSHAAIAKSIGIGETTVGDCLQRVKRAKLSWPLPEDFDDEQLEKLLYPSTQKSSCTLQKQGDIDWAYIHKELKRKSVTLQLLWNEHNAKYPESLRYSQFCRCYREWAQPLGVWMHQVHKAGEKLFVDYAGQTMPVVINTKTGEIREAQIFVATLGASDFTYVEATWTQTLPDWIGSHVRAFEFFGGCPEIVVPDNLVSGITKAHLYEPHINFSYQDMAVHYGVVIMPARVRSPKDKGKVEQGVQQTERMILAALRNRTFFSLQELNGAIALLLADINKRPFQKLPGSRLSQFLELEKPALKSLPSTPYEYAEWKKVRAGFNYHVEIEGHHYSVPFILVKRELLVRHNEKTVEVFHQNKRVASHLKSHVLQGYTTDKAHMPKNHQKHVEWTPERIASWAKKTGPQTSKFVEALMNSRPHPQQGFRSCLGVLRLAKSYGAERLEAACNRALSIKAYSFKSVESILKNNLENSALPGTVPEKTIPDGHENVRGQHYFD